MPYSVGDSKKVIVGAAAFFVADATAGAVLPSILGTDTTSRAEDLLDGAAAWKNVGFTDGGVEVSYEPTYGDVTVDQLLDSAVIFKSGMKVMVNTTFSEATLENLVIVWGQASDTLDDVNRVLTIEGGSLGEAPNERALAFVGPAPRQTASDKVQRLYHVTRAIQTQTTAHSLKRDAATALPVSFRCLPGTAVSGGTAYGTVRDRAFGA